MMGGILSILLLLTTTTFVVVDAFDVCAVALAAPRNTRDMTSTRVFTAADEVCALPTCTLYKRTLAAISELPTIGGELQSCVVALVAGKGRGPFIHAFFHSFTPATVTCNPTREHSTTRLFQALSPPLSDC